MSAVEFLEAIEDICDLWLPVAVRGGVCDHFDGRDLGADQGKCQQCGFREVTHAMRQIREAAVSAREALTAETPEAT